MPVISNLVYTVTSSTIVATWTTDVPADSHLSAGGKGAIDNGYAPNSTSHQCIVVGLLPSTGYSCFVTSGGTSSSTTTQTTSAAATRILVTSAKNGAVTLGSQANNTSDTQRTFLSNDNLVYVTQDDGTGIVAGSQNAGFNTQVASLTNETNMTGNATLLNTYGAAGAFTGTDGPGGVAMNNKSSGIFGLNGNLHMFVYRQLVGSSNRYCNWIKSTNHGSTWNNFNQPSTFVSGGNPVTPYSPAEPVQFYTNTIGLVTPVLYAADDGTLGYTTSGNGIDGGNAFVYMVYLKDNDLTTLYLMRLPRIYFDNQDASVMQYWAGPAYPSPANFVNDNYWSSSPGSAVNIKPSFPVGVNLQQSVWYQPAFVPAINSYVLHTTGYYNGNTSSPQGILAIVYSAPTPAGPWTLIYTQANTAPNSWWSGFFPFHRGVAGNIVTADIGYKVLFSGSNANYCINYSTLTLQPSSGAEMVEQFQYGFATVENPLSFNSNFSTIAAYNTPCQVTGAGICRGTVGSGAVNSAVLTGAIPSGDTGGAWPADQYAELTVQTMTTITDFTNLRVRQAAGANTAYQITIVGTTGSPSSQISTVYYFVAGASTSLGTVTMTIASGDTIRLSVTGNVVTVLQNGVVKGTFTDAGNHVPSAGAPAFLLIPNTVAGTQISSFAAGANLASVPTFSPDGGTYAGVQTVTITGPSGSTIYYTLDGSTPTRSSSSIASGLTVSVTPTQTLKAISSKTNFVDSQVVGATYTAASAGGSTVNFVSGHRKFINKR